MLFVPSLPCFLTPAAQVKTTVYANEGSENSSDVVSIYLLLGDHKEPLSHTPDPNRLVFFRFKKKAKQPKAVAALDIVEPPTMSIDRKFLQTVLEGDPPQPPTHTHTHARLQRHCTPCLGAAIPAFDDAACRAVQQALTCQQTNSRRSESVQSTLRTVGRHRLLTACESGTRCGVMQCAAPGHHAQWRPVRGP